eukprot:TRINITY_DN1254_c0_g1_i1.p2 TRINITY_DN1254_c0_g1~~TRINITY_DN1254_c0_g1_i1.p2  ORF type:complete len:194 (-),score=97.43 TRINITY_DN1254_c0_g1_i1:939-1520(-)
MHAQAEVENVCKDFLRMFQTEEEAKMASFIQKTIIDIDTIHLQKENHAKETIKALQLRVGEAERESKRTEPEGAHEERMKEIEKEEERHQRNIKEMEDEIQELERKTLHMKKEKESLVHQLNQNKKERKVEVPKAEGTLNLYVNISGIRWEENEDQLIKGFVPHPKSGSVSNFELDPSKQTKSQIVNHLWSLL